MIIKEIDLFENYLVGRYLWILLICLNDRKFCFNLPIFRKKILFTNEGLQHKGDPSF